MTSRELKRAADSTFEILNMMYDAIERGEKLTDEDVAEIWDRAAERTKGSKRK